MSYARAQSEIDRMVEMRLEGTTLQKIGDYFGISRERVRQILAEEGMTGVPWTGYQTHHYRRVARAVATIAHRIDATAKPWESGFPHGTVKGYHRGCTCDRCRTASRERVYKSIGFTPKNPRPEWRKSRTDGSRRAETYGKKLDKLHARRET